MICVPDPAQPHTSTFVQLAELTTPATTVFERMQDVFPSLRCSLGFSNEPYVYTSSTLLDCLKSNLVVWIHQRPHVLVPYQLDFNPAPTKLSKVQQYELLDQLVSQRSKRYMYAGASFMVTQLSAMIYLTYELGWDVMEPVSYLVGLGTTILGAAYYAFFRKEYTYEDAFQRLETNIKKSFQMKRASLPHPPSLSELKKESM